MQITLIVIYSLVKTYIYFKRLFALKRADSAFSPADINSSYARERRVDFARTLVKVEDSTVNNSHTNPMRAMYKIILKTIKTIKVIASHQQVPAWLRFGPYT